VFSRHAVATLYTDDLLQLRCSSGVVAVSIMTIVLRNTIRDASLSEVKFAG